MRKGKTLVGRLMFWLGAGARRLRIVYLRMNGVKIGRNVFISLGAKIDTQFGDVEIGDDVHIAHGSCILAHDGAIKHTWISPGANAGGRVVIGKGAFIGVRAVILKDVVLGDYCVVGAGSVVTRSVPPYSLVCGNPGHVVRTFSPSLPETSTDSGRGYVGGGQNRVPAESTVGPDENISANRADSPAMPR